MALGRLDPGEFLAISKTNFRKTITMMPSYLIVYIKEWLVMSGHGLEYFFRTPKSRPRSLS